MAEAAAEAAEAVEAAAEAVEAVAAAPSCAVRALLASNRLKFISVLNAVCAQVARRAQTATRWRPTRVCREAYLAGSSRHHVR